MDRTAAIALLDARRIASGAYAYYADETRTWYIIDEGDLDDLAALLADASEHVRQDAYSIWCAGTFACPATPEQIAEADGW